MGSAFGFLLTAVLSKDTYDQELKKAYKTGKSIGYSEGYEDGSRMR